MADKAKWVYEDLDFDNRVSNLMWTISGNYDENMDMGERSFISRDVALYHGITAGGRRKYVDWDKVKKFVISRVKAGFDKDTLLGLVQMATDAMVEEKILAERPGVADIRKKAYAAMVESYYKLHTDNLMEKAQHAIVMNKGGYSVRMDSATSNLVKALTALNTATDTREMLKGIEIIYLSSFPMVVYSEDGEVLGEEQNPQNVDPSDFNEFMEEEYYDSVDDSTLMDIDDELAALADALMGEMDGGTCEGEGESAGRIVRIREEDLESIYEKVAFHFGASYQQNSDLRQMMRRICRGPHENCRVHLTDGVARSHCDNGFQKNFIHRQYVQNELAYRANHRVYNRNIAKLRDSIARTMVQEEFADNIPSDAGHLVANKLWRIGRSSNSKVFVRTLDKNKGSYVVDILIDSSGSQRRNQGRVAIQAYILAQALTQAGIPNRVVGFHSFLDYTVLKRYRDYTDSVKENTNIFEYYANGNNRDGLAIKTTVYDLEKREEENKIMIVLSDGKPNDIKVGKGHCQTLEETYRGQVAIRDTAIEVRRARQKGIMVLGVFTGKEKDLTAEKLIYGKDFVYIKDIGHFADMVIQYLKQIITG